MRYIDPQRDVAVELGERDIRREIMKVGRGENIFGQNENIFLLSTAGG